ncbi:MAG: hypothetical protein QXH30_02100 [Candidatus Bilamarchaeaceae archaeon]
MGECTEAQKFSSYLLERFGIALPSGVKLEGRKNLRMVSAELYKFPSAAPKGIPAASMEGIFPKPSTSFVQLFGNLATKNTVELNREETLRFAAGDSLETAQNAETGYVIVKFKGAAIGCGFYKDGKIANLFPKRRRITLK